MSAESQPHRWIMLAEFGRFWRFVNVVISTELIVPRQGSMREARGRIWAQMYEIGLKSVPVVIVTPTVEEAKHLGTTVPDLSFTQETTPNADNVGDFDLAAFRSKLESMNATVLKKLAKGRSEA